MSFTERYSQLNSNQKRAVDIIDGPVMVIAGPGTGKTELLSVRVANILQKTDTLPENILCLTFTESGQAAMRERLVGIIGKDAYKVAIHTFHSFGTEIMAQNREYFYRSALFEPADDLKQYEIIRGIFEELDYKNPLSSMMNGEYTHLSDAKKVISELKRNSALTSDELLAVIQQSELSLDTIERLLMPVLEERVGKGTAAKVQEVLNDIAAYSQTVEPLYEVRPLAAVITDSLKAMLEACETEHPTKPISAWKTSWLERDERKKLVFKDRRRLVKLKALSFVYFDYLSRMEKEGLFDYDDMVMQVVHAIEVYDDLRFNLQEKYLYIMVDEFQDTNLAQLRILHALTDNPVNEDTPNILVVGDDDQAIYGFQGADSSNIISFTETYPTRQLIALTDNYRSGASILSASRTVIEQGRDRLETRIPELNKRLQAHKEYEGTVEKWSAPTSTAERAELAGRIKAQLERGTNPSSIAVLARRHADIQSLLPFFAQQKIPVRYEREDSVLDSPPIIALEQVARVVVALADGLHDEVEALLPELLTHPAWRIEPKELWQLSLSAYTNRQRWMEVLATTPRFVSIHEWLIARAAEVPTTLLEPMIDTLIGRTETEDAVTTSPFYDYFFSEDTLATHPEAYLDYLEALRTIRTKLRDYQPNASLTIKDLLHFIELHKRLDIKIITSRYSVTSDSAAVQLLTAHKSKGLEFDTVYIYNAVDSVWGQSARSMSRSISYPENLPLAPAGSTADERLRLFYVAMTRAKQSLIMSYAEANDGDKQLFPADFMLKIDAPVIEATQPDAITTIQRAEAAWYEPLVTPSHDLRALLGPQLETFKLSATSLNSFLDVTRGGPQYFSLRNLLHFPQAKSAAAAYGTAVHSTMQQRHGHMNATGEEKPLEDSLHDFELALQKARLSEADYTHYLAQGSHDIPLFIASNQLPLNKNQKAEVSFGYQDVRIGEAKITGSLDMIEVDSEEKTIAVTDYKTGHPALAWDKGSEYTKIKLHKYRQQLLFYRILLEQSSEYHHYRVTTGNLAFIEPTKANDISVLQLDLSSQEIERTAQLIEAVWRHIITLNLPDTSAYSQDLKGILAFEQDLIDGLV